MLFMFSSVDERIDIKHHPKFYIIINNVSKYGEDYDIEAVENNPENASLPATANLSVEKRILDIKSQLKEGAKNFYMPGKISKNMKVG